MDNNQKDLNNSPVRTTSTPKSPPNIKLERELKRKEILNSRVFNNLRPVKLFEDVPVDSSSQANNLADTNVTYLVLRPS
jgi:hypothetical protein